MTLGEIAKAVGGTLNGRWIRIAGPGHRKRDDSLGFKLDSGAPDGFWVNSFAGDSKGECRAHVKQILTVVFKGDSLVIQGDARRDDEAAEAARLARALALWDQAQSPGGTQVEAYLRARGCEFPPSAAAVLRFHPACPFGPRQRYPAMIALMRDVNTGVPRGIQRTALKDDGTNKREMPDGMKPRMMLGRPKEAAILLGPAAEHMGIGEGTETSLSARQIFGIPVWAALSAEGIAAFPILPNIKFLTIFADYDKTGLRAARECCSRYEKASIEAEIRCPPNVGSDWNDFHIKVNHHGTHQQKDQGV
jgi:Toprim domain-containing protein